MTKPIAVLISDIHFTVPTLELAKASLLQAQHRALELDIPLIICGDTLDGKALMRAECTNSLIDILSVQEAPETYILAGNHDMLNEKSKDHALNFLIPYAQVIDRPLWCRQIGSFLIPYTHNPEELKYYLKTVPYYSQLIMHQGVQTAYLGHYVQDKASLPKEAFANFRVISGHYHRAQTIQCGEIKEGNIGLFSYVGNPYSLSFGEASDGPKGYQILFSDGSMQQAPLLLRKHVVIDGTYAMIQLPRDINIAKDLIWLKVHGPKSELDKINKKDLGAHLFGHSNFKLDLIADDRQELQVKTETMTNSEILDSLIDSTSEQEQQKTYLKSLWRELI